VTSEWKCFSRNLLGIERRVTVLRWTILALVLGIGTTLDTFHNLGKWPLVMDRLNRFVSKGAILSDVALSMHAKIIGF